MTLWQFFNPYITLLFRNRGTSPSALFVGLNFLQMGVGLAPRYFMARITVKLLRKFDLDYEGLYPVFVLSLVFLPILLSFLPKAVAFRFILWDFLGKSPFT